MSKLDTSQFDWALKTLYRQNKLLHAVYKDNPTFAMMPKSTSFGGKNLVVPLRFADVSGVAPVFQTAQLNKNPTEGIAWTLTRVKDYGLASWDTETVLSSQTDERAFLRAVKTEMDSVLNALNRRLGIHVFRDGTGVFGQISAIAVSTNSTITMTNPRNISAVEVNQKIVAVETPTGTPVVKDAAKVLSVDRMLGKFVVEGDVTGFSPAWDTSGDYLAVEGSIAASNNARHMAGISSWIPDAAPGATLFFGVDRSVDTVRLGGLRMDGSTKRLDDAIHEMCVLIADVGGGNPDWIVCNFDNFRRLGNILEGRVEGTHEEVKGVGFDGYKFISPRGILKVYPDRNCPPDKIYVLQKDSWCFYSLGEAPMVLDLDGNKFLREGADDAYEVRTAWFGNMCCLYPPGNGVIHSLPTT